jgi:hypothetical protein
MSRVLVTNCFARNNYYFSAIELNNTMGNRQSNEGYLAPQENDPLQHTDSNQDVHEDDIEQGPPAIPQPNRQSVEENPANINLLFGPQFFLGSDRVGEDDFIPSKC